MKSFLYRSGSALLCALALIATGCQEDNEAAIKKQEATSVGAQVKTTEPPPRTQEEYGKRTQAQFQAGLKESSYYYSVTSHKSFCGNVLWLSTGDRVLVIACVRFDANPGFARGCPSR